MKLSIDEDARRKMNDIIVDAITKKKNLRQRKENQEEKQKRIAKQEQSCQQIKQLKKANLFPAL